MVLVENTGKVFIQILLLTQVKYVGHLIIIQFNTVYMKEGLLQDMNDRIANTLTVLISISQQKQFQIARKR